MYLDPIAARQTYSILSAAGVRIVFDPLDATNTVPLTRDAINFIIRRAETPEALFVAKLLQRVADTWFDPVNLTGLFIWDVTAALALIDPRIIETTEQNVRVNIIDRPAAINQVIKTNAQNNTLVRTCTRLNTSIGAIVRDPNGPITITTLIKSFNPDRFYRAFVNLLNSNHNTALCPLQEPVGCYEYRRISKARLFRTN